MSKIISAGLLGLLLMGCSAKVESPIQVPDTNWNFDEGAPVNPTQVLELKITSGVSSNFNKFILRSHTVDTYEVIFNHTPDSNYNLIYTNEVRATQGCDAFSYEATTELISKDPNGQIIETRPINYGEKMELTAGLNYQLKLILKGIKNCSEISHSFIVEKSI